MSKKTEYTGTFNEGCPGNAGIVHCKCEIYANKPIFKRRQQDQEFITSGETFRSLPSSFRDQFSYIEGLDGIFLKEIFNNRTNYLSFKKNFIDTDVTVVPENDVVKIEDLDFLTYSSYFDSVNRPAEKFESPHLTWIVDGSLFCPDVLRPSEYNSGPRLDANNNIDREAEFRRQYLSAWKYDISTNLQFYDTVLNKTSTRTCIFPYQYINAKESPVTALNRTENADLKSIFKQGDQYKGINPGIHWSAIKRTPLFRGQDFWVEFLTYSEDNNVLEHRDAIFAMQEKYYFLDVNSQSMNDRGEVLNGGVIELDKEGKVSEDSKQLYDFSKQAYFILEIGVNHPDHNYFLIINEKDYPVLVHAGKFVTLVPKKEDSNDNDTKSSKTDVKYNQYTQFIPKMSEQKISRKISSWKIARGKDILEKSNKNKRNKISVRNHMGSLVITFAGYEDNPWVIDRYDYVDKNISDEDSSVFTEDNIEVKRVPIIVPEAKIAIHAGNAQMTFAFGPTEYRKNAFFKVPQSISLLGPLVEEDLCLFLRDKGASVDLYSSSKKREYEFSMDAEKFTELVSGEYVDSFAIDTQPDQVYSFGKAPDAQELGDQNGLRIQSSIELEYTPFQDVGSSGDYVKQTSIYVTMWAGDYRFKNPDVDKDYVWHLGSCITPIITKYRLYVPPYGSAYDATPIDVSHHVMSFSDSWSAKDFNSIEHSGQIRFLVNDGMEFIDSVNYAPFLSSLIDKTFYLQVSVWWEGGVMPLPENVSDRIMITGLCAGGTMSVENGKKVLSCNIVDYYQILKDQKFLNSPFFDKMRDFNAVYEILKMAGMKDVSENDPASLLRLLSEIEYGDWFTIIHNGDSIVVNDYALPGSYDIIQQPFMRFSDGDSYSSAIEKIANLSGKVCYFDNLGVFHFENLPFEQLFFNSEGVDYQNPVEDYRALSKIDFYVSPREVKTSDFHRQVFNSYNIKRNVEDVVNEIRLVSTTPNGELLLAGHTNFESLFNHKSAGFIGYPKQFLQMDGVFGSEDAVKYIVKHYTKMFRPPVTINFEAFGHNKLKALDVITFRQLHSNDKQPLIIQSITSEVDPSKNSWMQNFECQWIFPSIDIDWGPTSDKTIN